jgi:hypothetical protein
MRPARSSRRTLGFFLAVVLASVVSGLWSVAEADDRSVPVTRQGDARTSMIPATYTPKSERIYVGHAGLAPESEAYVQLDLSSVQVEDIEQLQLSLHEAPAGVDESLRADAGVILACVAEGEFGAGRQDGASEVEVDCERARSMGIRGPDGRWAFDITTLVPELRQADRSVALVPDEDAGGLWRVAFVTTQTAVTARVVDDPEPQAPAAPADSGPSYPPPTVPALGDGFDLPPVPDVPATPTVPAPPTGPSLSPVAPTPDPGSTEEGPARLPAMALVLGPAATAALMLLVRSDRLEALARRTKENIVSIDQLPVLNRRLRQATVGAVVLGVVSLAAMTATTSTGTGPADLLAGGGAATLPDEAAAATADNPTALGEATTGAGATGAGAAGAGATVTSPSGSVIQSSSSSTSEGPGAPAAAAEGLSATDQGVTASTIKVSVFRLDPGYLATLGVSDPKTELVASAYAAEINDRGGIHGRRIEVDVVTVADISERSAEHGCRTALADHKSFMIVNQLAYTGLARCVARFGRGLTDSGFGEVEVTQASLLEAARGHYWIAGPTTDRLVEAWADLLVATHSKDTKIGLWNGSQPGLIEAGRQITTALTRRGFPKPSYFQSTADASTAAIQISNGAAQFRRDGVQLVLPLADPIEVGIVQRGFTANNYRPEKGWSFSSIANMDNADNADLLDPNQMNGAVGISWLRDIDEAEQAECREILRRRAPDAPWSASAAMFCHTMFQNASALENAGTNLTTATWAQGYSQMRTYRGNMTAVQTFSTAKRDGADQTRQWKFQDGEFRVTSPWR